MCRLFERRRWLCCLVECVVVWWESYMPCSYLYQEPFIPSPFSEAPTFWLCTASFTHEKQTSLGISNVFPSLGFFIVDNKTLTPHKKNLVFHQILSFVSIPPTPSLPQFTVFYHMNHLSFFPQWLCFLCEIKADSRRAFQPFHEEASSAACRAPFPQATPVTFSFSFLLLTRSSRF